MTRIKPEKPKNAKPKKLSETQIDRLISQYNDGVSQKMLAEMFGISRSTVSRYVRERRESNF